MWKIERRIRRISGWKIMGRITRRRRNWRISESRRRSRCRFFFGFLFFFLKSSSSERSEYGMQRIGKTVLFWMRMRIFVIAISYQMLERIISGRETKGQRGQLAHEEDDGQTPHVREKKIYVDFLDQIKELKKDGFRSTLQSQMN